MRYRFQNRSAMAWLFVIALGFWPSPSDAAPSAASGKSATKAASSKPAPAKKPPPAPDAKTEAKVSLYITIMNKESEAIFEERGEWLRKVRDPKAGPTCKEQSLNLSRNVGRDEAETYAEYKKKLLAKPKLEADAAALKMVEALEDLRKPTEEGAPYFFRKDLEKSRCAKTKELFPILMAGWNKYAEGYEALREFVDKFTDERDAREVESTAKKYGKRHRYHFARLVTETKALLRTMAVQARKSDPDPAPVQEKLASLSGIVDEAKSLITKDNDAKKGDSYPPGLSLLLFDSMPGFQKTVKTYLDTVNAKTAKNRTSALKSDWERVVRDYNKMIDQMNGVQFGSGQK
jgi:hypothetical protein